MFDRFRRVPIMFMVALVVSGGVATAHAASSEDTARARTFIENLADETVRSLTAPGIDRAERHKRFRKLMRENFAFKRIAAWVMGRYWRRATAAQKSEYLKLFEDLLVLVYADRFAKYSGETLDVGRSESRGENDILVHSKIVRTNGLKPVEVAWRIFKHDDAFKIVDVMVEGLSMGLTQQKEFASVIRQNGNGVQGLIDELKKRIASNS